MTRFEKLKAYIQKMGWQWKPGKTIPYGNQIIVKEGGHTAVVSFYPKRGKVVIGGPPSPLQTQLQVWLGEDQSMDSMFKQGEEIKAASKLDQLKTFVDTQDWNWGPGAQISHGTQIIVTSGTDVVQVNYWPKREVIHVQGEESSIKRKIAAWIGQEGSGLGVEKKVFSHPHIGMDESGKGDPFGPLVVAAVYANEDQLKRLNWLGVRDSKLLGFETLQMLAGEIERLIPKKHRFVRIIYPESYNELYLKYKNINILLSEVYAETANPVYQIVKENLVICDQFSKKPERLEMAFLKEGLPKPKQLHKAESASLAVAAASILASVAFADALITLGEKAGLIGPLPKGASKIQDIRNTVRFIEETYGRDRLQYFAKMHFKTIKDLLKPTTLL